MAPHSLQPHCESLAALPAPASLCPPPRELRIASQPERPLHLRSSAMAAESHQVRMHVEPPPHETGDIELAEQEQPPKPAGDRPQQGPAQPPQQANRTANPAEHPVDAADGSAAGSGRTPDDPNPGWQTRLVRWFKHTHLYEFTSTGHEDACAFECSRVAGRRGRYWPALYPEEALKKSCWLRTKRFWVSLSQLHTASEQRLVEQPSHSRFFLVCLLSRLSSFALGFTWVWSYCSVSIFSV